MRRLVALLGFLVLAGCSPSADRASLADPVGARIAAVTAAAASLLNQSAVSGSDQTPRWRFSGRWFAAGPFALRRPQHFGG